MCKYTLLEKKKERKENGQKNLTKTLKILTILILLSDGEVTLLKILKMLTDSFPSGGHGCL